jgi:4-alpha-glucanotransferase
VDEVIQKAYSALAGGRARIVAATIEDALAVVEQPNRPGVLDDRNWQLPLPGGLEALKTDRRPRALAAAISRARKG